MYQPQLRADGVEPLEQRTLFAVPDGFVQELIAGGLDSPTAMTIAPDGRVFVTQQGGAIRVVKDGVLLPTPFATVPALSGGESGLLGITLHPDFKQNGFVYVYYTTSSPNIHNRVSRLTANGDVAVPGSETHIFDQAALDARRPHDGGAMRFGPDGKLYIGVGDHTLQTVAQQLTNTLGKILRINPDGSIPTDNPYYNQTTGLNRAIWALGLRNPFSIAFQPGTGRLHINDVGHVGDSAWEEVNLGVAGANYGWPGIEGPRTTGEVAPANYQDPYYSYIHGPRGVNGNGITGGVFYNPPATATRPFPAQYHGNYFFLDFNKYVKALNPDKSVSDFATGFDAGVGLDVGPDGSLYYVQRGRNGSPAGVFRIRYTGAQAPPALLAQPAPQRVTVGEPASFTVAGSGAGPLSYQWLRNDAEIPGATEPTFTIPSPTLAENGDVFRARVSNPHGSVLSDAVLLTVETNRAPVPVISTPTDGTTFVGGVPVGFSGSASDPDEGPLAAASLSWSVSYFTGVVERPSMPATPGIDAGVFTPDTRTPYLGTDVKYRIYLTATDGAGRQATTFRDITPIVGSVTLEAKVGDVAMAGFALQLDGNPRTSPSTDPIVAGLVRQIGAPLSQVVNGVTYDFVGWSDGGAAAHDVSVPESPVTFTATYAVRPPPPPPPPGVATKVNFQPAAAPAVSGYLVDAGLTFAARNGRQYGWTVSHADTVFDRNQNTNQLNDTHAAFKQSAKWELAVPNGKYTVKVGVGDSAAASTNNIWVEGVQAFNYVKLAANVFRSATVSVTVSDGRLTVAPGGSANLATRINFVEIAPAVPPPPPPASTTTKINFQPSAAPAVGGYLIDAGLTYAARNGHTYGWTTSHAANVIDRGANADQLLDTNVAVKAGAKWELAVANGTYAVKVAAGDAGSSSNANVWVEGIWHYKYVPLAANAFRTDSITVTVTDGRLTLAVGGAADGAVRLNYVEVTRV